MRILYFDCSNGISGDMLNKAVIALSGKADEIRVQVEGIDFDADRADDTDTVCAHSHGRHDMHRGFGDVARLIESSGISEQAVKYAVEIYRNIARAESEVHGATIETVHFHEVGRDEAIKNAIGTALAVEAIAPDSVISSPVFDGHGTVVCSHGEIPVPVPAVMALMSNSSLEFRQADVATEMVTPSGLAGLMGIGAAPLPCAPDGIETDTYSPDKVFENIEEEASVESFGSRETGRPGLRTYILYR